MLLSQVLGSAGARGTNDKQAHRLEPPRSLVMTSAWSIMELRFVGTLITLRPNMGSRRSTERSLGYFVSLVTLGSGMCKALQGARGNQIQ